MARLFSDLGGKLLSQGKVLEMQRRAAEESLTEALSEQNCLSAESTFRSVYG